MNIHMHFCSFDKTCKYGGRNDRVFLFIGSRHWFIDVLRWSDRGYYKQGKD